MPLSSLDRRGWHKYAMRKWINLLTESFGTVLNFDPMIDDSLFNLDRKAAMGTIHPSELKAFAKMLRSHKMDYIRMYHATSHQHDVMGKGLLPTSASRAKSIQSTHGFVYLSYDPNRAINFARMAYAGNSNTKIVVYAVDLLVKRLLPDHDQLYNKRMWGGNADIGSTIADSMIYGGGARVRGKIDPTQIHIWGTFDRNGDRIEEDDA